MSERLRLSLITAGVFLLALAVGALVADALTAEDGPAVLPEAVGEPIPLLSGVPDAGQPPVEEVLETEPYRPIEVDAEYVALDFGEAGEAAGFDAFEGGSGAGSDPGFGDGSGEAPGDDGPGTGVAAESEDPGFEEERRSDLPFLDLMFPDLILDLWRFMDPCAATPDDPGCPEGTGGTILLCDGCDVVDLAGPFRLSGSLYPVPRSFSRCPDTSRLRSNEYAFMLLATHPARIDISFYPSGSPSDVTTATADVSDPTHREFTRFVETVQSNGGPVGGRDRVQFCFVIDGGRAAQTIVIDAVATSFTGETASDTFSLRISERRNRPPITVAALSDYEANIAVPVRGDGMHTTKVRAIHSSMGLTCPDIEAGVLVGEIGDVVLAPGDLPPSSYLARDPMGDIIESADWRYDPAYSHYDFWNLRLEEGSNYQLCVWWIRSAERSFDSATVVEREMRWINTPDSLRARIRVVSVRAPTTAPVSSRSIAITGPCAGFVQIPSVDLDRDQIESYRSAGGITLCDFAGFQQPPISQILVTHPDGSRSEFAVPTPNSGLPRSERVLIDLTEERVSGLCGGSFGSCDPPTSIYPGSRIVLVVDFYEAGSSHRDDWNRGTPSLFDTPEVELAGLSEEIQIDRFGSGLEPDGRDAVMATVEFDRPVTLQAQLEGELSVYCLEGDPPTFSTDSLAAVHSFSINGLCTRSNYAFELIATDAEGGSRIFRNEPSREWGWWHGLVRTDGYNVEYFVSSLTALGDGIHVDHFGVTVAGHRIDLSTSSECLTSTRSTVIPGSWGETIELTVAVLLTDSSRDASGSCPYARGTTRWDGLVETSFTIEDFMAGTVLVDVPLTNPRTGPELSGVLQITLDEAG